MKVTDLQPGKKDPKRINVFLDGKFAFALSREIQIVEKIKNGQSLTQEKINQLIFQDQVGRLYDKAIKFLSFRPRSKKEIRDNLLQKLKLSDKGEDEKKNFTKSIEEALKKLEKLGFINDQEFAKWWLEQRTRFKKISPRLVKNELLNKGVERSLIDEVLSKVEVDPLELATAAAEKKLSTYKKLEPQEFKVKLGRYLAAKGFDWQTINKVVDTLLEEE